MDYALQKSTTKKLAPLKLKHMATLTEATHHRECVDLFRQLGQKLRDPNWMVVFKSLILLHILIREGNNERVMNHLVANPELLDVHGFRDNSLTASSIAQSKNIRLYAKYLQEKLAAYSEIGTDLIKNKNEKIAIYRSAPINNQFLREVGTLQKQITALLACSFYEDELDNVITLQAFRVLVGDMMALFHLANEAVIRILGGYFELPKAEAERSLVIYKTFAQQTTKTVQFFDVARRMSHQLSLDVPTFKHAPTSLVGALEEYLNAPDFEQQREAYRAKKLASKSKQDLKSSAPKKSDPAPKKVSKPAPPSDLSTPVEWTPSPTFASAKKPESPKKADQLIDFFASMEVDPSSIQTDFNVDANFWAGGDLTADFGGLGLGTTNTSFGLTGAGSTGLDSFGLGGASALPTTSTAASANPLVLHPFASNALAGSGLGTLGGARLGSAPTTSLATPTATTLPAGFNPANNPFAISTPAAPIATAPVFGDMAAPPAPVASPPFGGVSAQPFGGLAPRVASGKDAFTIENVFGDGGGFPGSSNNTLGMQRSMTQPTPAASMALTTGGFPLLNNTTNNNGFGAVGMTNVGGFGGFGGVNNSPFGTLPSASVAAGPALGMGGQPAAVKDSLASLNPFAKPSVPLAAMQTTQSMGMNSLQSTPMNAFGGQPAANAFGGNPMLSMTKTTSQPPFGTTNTVSSPFGNAPVSSPFGNATTASSPFGNANPVTGMNAFSTTTSTASPFGMATTTTSNANNPMMFNMATGGAGAPFGANPSTLTSAPATNSFNPFAPVSQPQQQPFGY